MTLLPRQHGEFAKEQFWDDFFKARGKKSFDWYGEYAELAGVVHKYVRPADSLLMVGCGNSRLSEDLYDLSYHSIHNIDISQPVVKHMSERNAAKRPHMLFTRMDATKMTFADEEFKAAIDKGTLDALLPDVEHAETAVAMATEVWRVLKYMGCYVIISLAQDHVLSTLVRHFSTRACIFRAHRLPTPEGGGSFVMPVFAFVITKLKPLANMSTIWELCLHEDGKSERFSDSVDLVRSIKECQYYAMLQSKLQLGSYSDAQDHPAVKLYSKANPRVPRYTIFVVDGEKQAQNKMAVFIVPQGKEDEWLFSTLEGRKELASSVGYQRLLVVTLSRGHSYRDVDEVKSELSAKVMDLAPPNTNEKNAPFLTTPEGIGIRSLLSQWESVKYDTLYVEDVNADAKTTLRQTYYQTAADPDTGEITPYLIGSAKVSSKKSKKTAQQQQQQHARVITSELISQREYGLAAALCLSKEPLPAVLLVGLGCGTLAAFVSQHMVGAAVESLECVEGDASLVEVARTYYGLPTSVKVMSSRADISQESSGSFDCVIVQDTSSCSVEDYVKLLKPSGLLITAEDLGLSDFTHQATAGNEDTLVFVYSNVGINHKAKGVKRKLQSVKDKLVSEKTTPSATEELSAILERFSLRAE